MSTSLRAADREPWSTVRARGFVRFLWSKTLPTGLGFAAGNALMPFVRAGRRFDWKESALWFGWGLFCGCFWAVITWWTRERAFRNSASGRDGAAA